MFFILFYVIVPHTWSILIKLCFNYLKTYKNNLLTFIFKKKLFKILFYSSALTFFKLFKIQTFHHITLGKYSRKGRLEVIYDVVASKPVSNKLVKEKVHGSCLTLVQYISSFNWLIGELSLFHFLYLSKETHGKKESKIK